MSSLILHGKRLVEFQKWRHLSISVNIFRNGSAFSNSFSSAVDASRSDGRKGSNFTTSYLVDSLGLSTKLAESISRKVRFEDKRNPDSVLNLLRSHGFTDSQISSVITVYPELLIADAEKSLGPKLQFLKSRGASTSELTEIVSTVPKILEKRWGKASSIYYDFVKNLVNLIYSHCSSPITNLSVEKKKFQESLKRVVEMGFDPTTLKFVEALNILYGMSDKAIEETVNTVYKRLGFTVGDVWTMFRKYPMFLTLSEKNILNSIEIMKRCGLLEDDVLSLLKKFPRCLSYSEQKILNSVETFIGLGLSRAEFVTMIKRFPEYFEFSAENVKKKTEFVVKKMNWPLMDVVSNPAVLGYSMEMRIVPRCNVIKALISKGLLGTELPPISSVLRCTDEVFLKRYVRKHDDKELVAELMSIFTGDHAS